MRVHVCAVRMTLHRADVLEAYLNGQDNILSLIHISEPTRRS